MFAMPIAIESKNRMYYIYTTAKLSYSYGSKVLYYLCEQLNDLGYICKIINSEKTIIEKDDIVIYDESVSGNPLNAKKVVRYLLNQPWIKKGIHLSYSDSDCLIAYSTVIDPFLYQLYLLVDDMDLVEKYRSEKKADLVCFYFGKFRRGSLSNGVKLVKAIHSTLPLCKKIITKKIPASHEETLELLASACLLISFDGFSSINYEATLLNTPVFVVNDYNHIEEIGINIEQPGIFYSYEDFIENKNKTKEAFLLYKSYLASQNELIKTAVKYIDDHFEKMEKDENYIERNKKIINKYNKNNIESGKIYSIYTYSQVPKYIRKISGIQSLFTIPEFITCLLTDLKIAKKIKNIFYGNN